MVKAIINFLYKIDKDGRYHQDGKLTQFKKGDTVPDGIVPRIAYGNPEYLEGCLDQKKRKEIVDEALGNTNKLVEEKKIETKKPRYTEKELYDLTKAEQVEMLEKFGISASEVRLNYSTEPKRVKKLLELYGEEL